MMSDNGGKFLPKGLGQAWNQGLIGDFTIRLAGSGLVGTCFGMPGVSATRVGTGLYDIRYGSVVEHGARLYPHVVPPEFATGLGLPFGQGSGASPQGAPAQFGVNMSHVGGQSGVAYVNTTQQRVAPTGPTPTYPTVHVNPPTGAVINVQVFGSPVTRY